MQRWKIWLACCGLALVMTTRVAAQSTPEATAEAQPAVLFDDFNYTSIQEFEQNGWIVRTVDGWPGVPGARWGKESASFLDDPDEKGNRLLQMTAWTDGKETHQAQVCQARKFYEGTYATRVKFNDKPASGPGGDHLVETFYMISPLEADLAPNYSELDFEYLPNGGWGTSGHNLFVTTWETFRPEPNWLADNTSDQKTGSLKGWHTLALQVMDGEVHYFLDGEAIAIHGGKYYPEMPMSLNYNLWFIADGILPIEAKREYVEQIDWTYFAADTTLSPDEINAQVTQFRDTSTTFQDTVPAAEPPLTSPCNF
jgi:hypothetical protein